MNRLDAPANVTIMKLTPQRLQAIKPVSVLDIFDGSGTNFHEEGLFSTSIFGRVGSDERDTRFSYIDLKTTILHPLIYQHLVKLKGLYGGIMAGKAYAVWDDKEKDFLPSNELEGKTGYYFFMQNWQKIVHKATGSDNRDMRISLMEKFKDEALVRYVLVIPAGLRDIQIDETGRTKEGEINPFYRSIIAISNAIGSHSGGDTAILDTSRNSLQNAFNNVYDYLHNLIEGKGGFLMQKWGARRIFHGTRNVITSMDTSANELGLSNSPKINSTTIGLYQLAKGALPKVKYALLNGWLKNVFSTVDSNANLINPTSLKRESVRISTDVFDRWMSNAGLEKIITSFQEPDIRLKPIVVEDMYVGLIYRGAEDHNFRIFGDIDEMPLDKGFKREDVYPISLCELIYLSYYKEWNNLGAFITRYPVTGIGSIYPSYPYVKTTIRGEMRWELNDQWERIGEDHVAVEFPTFKDPAFLDTMAPHPSRLSGLGGDFDGDTSSANIVYTDEALAEISNFLKTRAAYVDSQGRFRASPIVETVERVLVAMTGD